MSTHAPHPIEEAGDQIGKWTWFHDFFGGGKVELPLLDLRPYHIPFTLTRFMIVELIAAGIVAFCFIWLARRVKDGDLPRGRRVNFLESLLLFVRDEIARPVMGDQNANLLLPYLWTAFFFVLICNLIGLVPTLGSPTASIWVTGGLALCSFILFHAVPIAKIGFLNYLKTMWVPTGLPWYAGGPIISLLLFVIELAGTAIKATVLAIRLFANIFAGHVVLATILTFAVAANILTGSGAAISLATVLGAVALSLLDLLVAFLQAYIFTFLTALFIGLPLIHHAEHEAAHGHGHEAEHDRGHGHAPTPVPGH